MNESVIGYAGMTHLGVNSAIAAAEKGFRVVCYDADKTRAGALARQELQVVEPGLPELLSKNIERLRFTASASDLADCDVVYIAPDVPTDDAGQSELQPVLTLLNEVHAVLPPASVIVILSQVPPGFSRTHAPAGRPLYYQVETLIFGRAVERALYPERFIVGCADPTAPLAAPYARFLAAFNCPVLPMRYESAELAKISINMCLVAMVSTANTAAELCERIGADWSEIVPALKLDRRIGQYAYLSPGLGLAGGNLERDLATVCALADARGTDARVVRAWIANSRHRKNWALRTLHTSVLSRMKAPVIAVLGLAYKEDTHSTKNSASLELLAHLHSYAVRVFDPVVPASAAAHPRLYAAESELDACMGADVVVIMTPWARFRTLDIQAIAQRLHGKVLIDPYALLKGSEWRAAALDYYTLGIGTGSIRDDSEIRC
jgi:UDPglucose 6-dehydrogenase